MCPNCPKFTAIHAGANDTTSVGQITEEVERDNLLLGRATAGQGGRWGHVATTLSSVRTGTPRPR